MLDIENTTDPEALRAVSRLLDAEVRRLQRRLKETTGILAKLREDDSEAVQKHLELLDEELKKRHEHAYSSGSERRPRDAADKPQPDKKPPSKKGSARTPQPALPLEHVTMELDAADCGCPCCGGELKIWPGKEDVSEVVDVVETRYVLKTQSLSKYRCKCGHIETALGLPKLTPRGRYTVDFGIHIVLARYCDLIPLDRLRKIMARSGLNITSQTLWDQVRMIANLLCPAKDRLLKLIQQGDVLIADETRWPLLGARAGDESHRTHNWCMWAAVGREGVVYEIQDSRSNEAGAKLLGDFKGVVLADGYVVYRSLAKRRGGFVLAHDWVHVRRKFLAAETTDPKVAAPFMEDIGKLFLIEREIATATTGLPEAEALDLCRKIRLERSRPIVALIGRRAAEIRALKDSLIAQALTYLETCWEGLQVYLTNPSVPITSNSVEAALRSPVVGRKISLGSRTMDGVEATGILHTLIESAQRCDIAPAIYLKRAISAALVGDVIPLPHEIV